MISKLDRHALMCRFRRRLKHSGRAALILPPSRPGSLGDQAMLRATLTSLRRAGFNHIGILNYDQADQYTHDPDIQHHHLKDYLCFGLEEGLMRFILHAQSYTHFFLIGADVMDGYYSAKETLAKIELARLGKRCGLNTSLLGFSFNAHADAACVDALRSLPTTIAMYARDPVSQHRLSKLLGRNIAPSADLAFLLAPNAAHLEVRSFLGKLHELKANGRILIGINVAYLVLGTAPTETQVEKLLEKIREVALAMAAQYPNITFIFYAHDKRGRFNDSVLANRLADSLRGELAENQFMLPPEPLESDEIKALCAPLDCALTSRMHFGIACLSQGVPIAAIGYQGKFEGLMERFDLENMLLPDANAMKKETLAALMNHLIATRADLRASVLEKLPRILQLAANNFSNCLPQQTIAELARQGKGSANVPACSAD